MNGTPVLPVIVFQADASSSGRRETTATPCRPGKSVDVHLASRVATHRHLVRSRAEPFLRGRDRRANTTVFKSKRERERESTTPNTDPKERLRWLSLLPSTYCTQGHILLEFQRLKLTSFKTCMHSSSALGFDSFSSGLFGITIH